MADRPILFSAPMIQALLAGRKTQTRRVVKKSAALDAIVVFGSKFMLKPGMVDLAGYAIGDRLWVRERLTARPLANFLTGEPTRAVVAAYAADDEDVLEPHGFNPEPWWKYGVEKRRPLAAMHMPRWASRLTLVVSDVRVQRLQEITEADARAEGIERVPDPRGDGWKSYEVTSDGRPHPHAAVPNREARTSFRELWNALHGADAWDLNRWICAISFEVRRGNIDQLEAG